jgi:hypothetical protein
VYSRLRQLAVVRNKLPPRGGGGGGVKGLRWGWGPGERGGGVGFPNPAPRGGGGGGRLRGDGGGEDPGKEGEGLGVWSVHD